MLCDYFRVVALPSFSSCFISSSAFLIFSFPVLHFTTQCFHFFFSFFRNVLCTFDIFCTLREQKVYFVLKCSWHWALPISSLCHLGSRFEREEFRQPAAHGWWGAKILSRFWASSTQQWCITCTHGSPLASDGNHLFISPLLHSLLHPNERISFMITTLRWYLVLQTVS